MAANTHADAAVEAGDQAIVEVNTLGQVCRSDSLDNFTPDDLAVFDSLGVRVIYDLRRDDEREKDRGPRACVHLTLPSRRVGDTDLRHTPGAGTRREMAPWAISGNVDGSWSGLRGTAVSIDSTNGLPAVYGAGGKDRTGMAAALLLSWLEVDRETVLDDYELSNQYDCCDHVPSVVDHFIADGTSRPAEAMLSAPRWAMAEVLDWLDTDYGGIQAYLRGPAEWQTQHLNPFAPTSSHECRQRGAEAACARKRSRLPFDSVS